MTKKKHKKTIKSQNTIFNITKKVVNEIMAEKWNDLFYSIYPDLKIKKEKENEIKDWD